MSLGDGTGVELDDLVQCIGVVGGFDGGGGAAGGGGQPPDVDVEVCRVEVVALVGAGDDLGVGGFGEDVAQLGDVGVEAAAGVVRAGFGP